MSSDGFILLHRELIDKAIWKGSTPEQRSVLIASLLMANHAPAQWEWQGEKFYVQPGQFITSLQKIVACAGRGVSIQNVRSSIKRFKKLGFLTETSTKTGRLITILNWEKFQRKKNIAQQNPQQRPNKESTPNNNEIIKQETYICIFEHWNSQNIIVHRKLSDKDKRAINDALKDSTHDLILKAITNYSNVLQSPDHYFNHKWILQDFLRRGLRKFVDEADPWNNFKKGNNGTWHDEKTERLLEELD